MKDLYALTEKRSIDLSLSENPLGCSPRVIRAFKSLELVLNDYPAPNGGLLRKSLATKFCLKENNFFIANGSESIIHDLPRVFGGSGSEVIVPALSFPMFAICSELAGNIVRIAEMTQQLGIDLGKVRELLSGNTKIVFICNPNNPTGSVLPRSEVLQFLDTVPQSTLVVVDEANIEFGGESVVDEVSRRNNLVVLRTFSKGFGLAAIRVGFAVAHPQIIQKLEEETPVFQTSRVSEKLAEVALKDASFITTTRCFVSSERQVLRTALQGLGFHVFPSVANNLFVEIPTHIDQKKFADFLKRESISLVMGSSFTGFDNSFFRLSVRDQATNKLFIATMQKLVNESRCL